MVSIDLVVEEGSTIFDDDLTVSEVGPTWEVSSRFMGPPLLNSLLGVMTQKPTMGPPPPVIQPWTALSLLSMEYSYLSSTSPLNCGSCGFTSSTASL
jgi:hypothetical protein